MKISECFPYTFKALRHELGHDRPKDQRPMWQRRLSTESAFCRALVACGYLTEAQMRRAAERYRLGMSRDGGVIFWQMDQLEQVYDGKIMYYRPDCHRDHDRHPQWAANLLKRQFLRQFPDMASWMPDSVHCLFGTHLLGEERKAGGEPQPCAVVEAEKTAVILSEHFPRYLWLAAGGLNELTHGKLFPLRRHRIILFPDTDEQCHAYTLWYRIAQEASWMLDQTVTVSPLLELRATPEQKRRKIDLVDFLFESPPK